MTAKISRLRWTHQILILLLLLLATWLRLWRPNDAPPGFWFDEAYNAMDALWAFETGQTPPFFVDNNGREAMLHYLGGLSMLVLGASPFAFRLISILTGILTIALLYRWILTLFADYSGRRWLALVTALGLSTSFWHLMTSRSGFRASLLPFFVVLVLNQFWLGLQKRSNFHLIGAGIALGLSQYTYLSARVLPLVLGVFVLIGTMLDKKQTVFDRKSSWSGLVIVAITSFIVFLPMFIFFVDDPTAFSARTGQSLASTKIAQDKISLAGHLLEAFTVFGIARDPTWGIGIEGRHSFGWHNMILLWVGLATIIKTRRRPAYQLLLITLLVLWLPGVLSGTPVHALRLAGMLPIYYAIVAIGFMSIVTFINTRPSLKQMAGPMTILFFTAMLIINGLQTSYDYFEHWAKAPLVHKNFNGPLYDFTLHLLDMSETSDLLLPFTVYAQPTTRLLLHDQFQEIVDPTTIPSPTRPLIFVDAKPELNEILHHVRSPSFVWLTRDETGQGFAYVSRNPPPDNFALTPMGESIPSVDPNRGLLVALSTPIESINPALPLFFEWPTTNILNYNLNNQFRLVTNRTVVSKDKSEPTITFFTYWQLLADADYEEHKLRFEIVDTYDNIVLQTEYPIQQLFRWRKKGAAISSRRTINDPLGPGIYKIRLTLTARTNSKLPIYSAQNDRLGYQAIIGDFQIE